MDYAAHYEKLISRARTRRLPRSLVERHHIIPKCMGGSNDQNNIARLTPEEHCLAHQLLAKMYPEHKVVVFVAWSMSNRLQHVRMPKNKRYGRARRAASAPLERTRRGNAIRARKRRAKRYSKADVARLAKILAMSGADFA